MSVTPPLISNPQTGLTVPEEDCLNCSLQVKIVTLQNTYWGFHAPHAPSYDYELIRIVREKSEKVVFRWCIGHILEFQLAVL